MTYMELIGSLQESEAFTSATLIPVGQRLSRRE
jgi:hypothetical protein